MNWSDPNFVALFAAWGQWVAAFSTLTAVAVAIWIAFRSSKESRKQSRQVGYDAARPVLVISEGPFDWPDQQFGHEKYSRISNQIGKPGWIDWNVNKHKVTLKNVGTGTAFNVISVLFGPESLNENGKSADASQNDYWQQKKNILSVGDKEEGEYWVFRATNSRLKKNVAGYSLLAPAQPLLDSSDKAGAYYEPTYVCRVTTTYHDIFKRKHMSIFDLDLRGNWNMTAILEDISHDLYDLQKNDLPSHTPLLKRLTKNEV